MQKYLITTVSSLALVIGAASLAAAQETTPGGAERPGGVHRSPDAGALQQENMGDRSDAFYRSYVILYEVDTAAANQAQFPSGFTAERLLGANVKNQQGEEIGEIRDLTIDSQNKVDMAIIEVGEFLGIGSKHVAVDISKLQAGTKGEGFVSTMSREQLEALPEYEKEGRQWVRQGAAGGMGSEPGMEGGDPGTQEGGRREGVNKSPPAGPLQRENKGDGFGTGGADSPPR